LYCIGIYLGDYVKRGILEDEWLLMFDRMRGARHTDQYSFDLSPTEEEAGSAIEVARGFVGRMEQLISETEKRQ